MINFVCAALPSLRQCKHCILCRFHANSRSDPHTHTPNGKWITCTGRVCVCVSVCVRRASRWRCYYRMFFSHFINIFFLCSSVTLCSSVCVYCGFPWLCYLWLSSLHNEYNDKKTLLFSNVFMRLLAPESLKTKPLKAISDNQILHAKHIRQHIRHTYALWLWLCWIRAVSCCCFSCHRGFQHHNSI